MRTGKLRHRLTIQEPTETKNAYGELITSWSTYETVWGSVEPLRGRELWAAREKEARIDVRIRIRYLADITAKMRIIFGSHIYQIESIIDVELLHNEMQLMCYEVTNVN